jgi:putative oxygen-independent coproporphyrinogen III oxidase
VIEVSDYRTPIRVRMPGQLNLPPPLALYVHLPWCVRKCPYCDFNSHGVRGEIPEQRYLDALTRDLERSLPQVWGREVSSIFIGGGTPSLFTGAGIDQLLTRVRTLLRVSPVAEITLEANPGTFEATRFKAYRAAGVNRLSLGIQSFNTQHLRALGRIHDADEARAAAESALTLFDEVNLDLMYALPEQSLEQAGLDIETAIGLAPTHVSAYHLTLEPNTPFAAVPPSLPDDDAAADMQAMVESKLANAGYQHYETSAFARPGHACRHNLNYWTFGDYLGMGAGAHGKLSSHDRIERQARSKHPQAYMNALLDEPLDAPLDVTGAGLIESRVLTREDRIFEFMMNALRLTEGFDSRLFEARTGLPLLLVEPALRAAEQRGLLLRDTETIRPSPHGRLFLNELLQMFLPETSGSGG